MKTPNIALATMQHEAVDEVTRWYRVPVKKSQIFYLAGYAGTGKTTLVPFIMSSIGIAPEDVCFATYTGKAAMVLSKKSGRAVSTIHSLCYELVEDYMDEKTNQIHMVWKLRKNSPASKAKLIVLDEVSMVSKAMMLDLMKFNTKILVLGDPFQLSPVEGDAYFHEKYEPDFFLTEIHRQALENPIIWLSQRVRSGFNIDFGEYGENVIKMPYNDAPEQVFVEADQIIVGTNKTRKSTNKWFRKIKGFDAINSVFPVTDDRLICLRNRWDDGLINGMLLTATSDAKVAHNNESFKLSFCTDENNQFTDMMCSAADVANIKLKMPYWEQKKLISIDYGYAITCHKSQGSQYDDVLFVDEGFGRWLDDNTYYRHLYTAITRAANNLIILE